MLNTLQEELDRSRRKAREIEDRGQGIRLIFR
jgi:hypothetical protein